MGEGLKLRKKQVEKSKEKLQSLEFVKIPSHVVEEIKTTVPTTHDSGKLLHEFIAATTCAQQIQCLKKCAASLQKSFSHASTNDAEQLSLTASSMIKILTSSPNPTINSIVVSFLNALHNQSTANTRITQTLAQETTLFVRNLGAATHDTRESASHSLAVLSSLLEVQLARESIEGATTVILSFLSSLLEKHASYFAKAGTQSLTEVAGECDIALRVLLLLLMKYSDSVGQIVSLWINGTKDSPVPTLFAAFISLLSHPATPRSCFTHIGVAFAQFVFLCGAPSAVQTEFENIFKFGLGISSTAHPASVLDRALDTPFIATFANLPTMAKLAFLRGTVFVKGVHANEILFGKLPTRPENGNLLTSYVFSHAVELTLKGGEQHSMIMGLQAAHGVIQRLTPVINEPQENTGLDKSYLIQCASQIAPTALHLAWTTWDSPVPSIPYHANLVFEALLDLVEACGESSPVTLQTITSRLLDVNWHQKGKYAPLSALLERQGVSKVLQIRGNFIPDMLGAIGDHGVCNSIKQLLEQFLISMRNQTVNSKEEGGKTLEEKLEYCYSFWLDGLVSLIVGPSDVISDHVSVYLLPVVLKHFPESLKILLSKVESSAKLQGSESETGEIRGILSVLKSARQMGLVDGNTLASPSSGFFGDASFKDLLSIAMGHRDIQLRLSAFELVCVSAKQTEFPTLTELAAVKTFLTANAKGAPPHVRFSTLGFIAKLWLRTKEGGARRMRLKTGVVGDDEASDEDIVSFLNWICSMCIASLYPGSPFPRKILPLELYSLMVDVWQVDEAEKNAPSYSPFIQKYLDMIMPKVTIFSEKNTTILLNGLWDRYDRCRQLANDILLKFPTPLPGFQTPEKVKLLLDWGWQLAQSPKNRECDTGAYVLRLVLCKYVAEGWNFSDIMSSTSPSSLSKENNSARIAVMVRHLVSELRRHVEAATKDMQYASRQAPMHGILLALRHLICELNFSTSATPAAPARKDKGSGGTSEITARIHVDVRANLAEWKEIISEMLDYATRASLAALHVVADIAPEGYTPKKEQSGAEPTEATPVAYFSPGMYENDEEFPDDDEDDGEDGAPAGKDQEYTSPAGQLITVCSWLTIKQVSLLLGHVVYRFPFTEENNSNNKDMLSVSIDQIQSIGQLLLRILLTTRHKGAIEKTYIGFQMLCERLLRCNEKSLFALPNKWIEQLFALVNDNSREITRRSAGLPYGFTAVLCAEASHTRTTAAILLPSVMKSLLTLANDKNGPTMPRIHAINILRAIFKTKALTHAIDPYLSDTLMTVVDAYTSPNWSIRNSAMMAYSVLLDKCVSLRRLRDEKTPLNTTTFSQFFSRYPPLYPFLLNHMQSSLADIKTLSHIHTTSVYAILLLISRLYPSLHEFVESETQITEANSNPEPKKLASMSSAPFIPLIQKCTCLPNSLVRLMASQALVPLIPTTKIHKFIQELLSVSPRTHNEAHGLLLQTLMLLKGHRDGMTDDQRIAILDIIPLLVPNLRFIGPNNSQAPFNPASPASQYAQATPCGPLAAVALETVLLLAYNHPISRPIPDNINSALTTVHAFARHVLERESFPTVVLWQSEMLVQAALLRVHASLALARSEKDSNIVLEVIAQLIKHPAYDVREVVLKLLSQLWKADSPDSLLVHNDRTYELITQVVQQETHPKTLFRSVKLMLRYNSTSSQSNTTQLNLWPRVRTLLEGQGPLRVCAAQILARLFVDAADVLQATQPLQQSLAYANEVCQKWTSVIDESTVPTAELDLRTAIVESLKATTKYLSLSNPLPPNSAVEKSVIRMWIILIRLLEDDNESIREKAAQVVSDAVANETKGAKSRTRTRLLMVSRALETAFAFLSAHFSHSQEYKDFLLKSIDDADESKEDEGIGKTRAARVLFDQEDTNAYIEELTIAQLAAAHLQKLTPDPTINDRLASFHTRMLKRVHTSTLQLSKLPHQDSSTSPTPSKQTELLLRWVTYEKEVFTPLYRATLALATLASPSSSSTPTQIIETVGNVKCDVHPLILHALHEWGTRTTSPVPAHWTIGDLSLFFLTSL